jgi:hypothetical protein
MQKQGGIMRKIQMITVSVVCLWLVSLLTFSFPAGASDYNPIRSSKPPDNQLDLIREIYGADIARVYETVKGMPRFDFKAKKKLRIIYSRNSKPCNEIFLSENPDMAEDCKKVRETVTLRNQHKKEVRVHIKDSEINSIDLDIPIDDRDPLKSRTVILLYDALIVHDCVMNRFSHNHAKIYHFPYVTPSVEFDGNHNLFIWFGKEEYIKFHAENFQRTESRGFQWRAKPKYVRNGTRAVPDISYEGNQFYMVTTNWRYPPLEGYFTLYDGSIRLGKVPATLFYKRLKNERALPLFKKTGLLNYLRSKYKDGSMNKRYGIEIHKFVKALSKNQES